jgi:hypothetical protein
VRRRGHWWPRKTDQQSRWRDARAIAVLVTVTHALMGASNNAPKMRKGFVPRMTLFCGLVATMKKHLHLRWEPAAPGTLRPETRQAPLPSIAGLDIEGGLKRVSGNTRLYRDLVRQFSEGQADASDRIRAALIAGDMTRAEPLLGAAYPRLASPWDFRRSVVRHLIPAVSFGRRSGHPREIGR